MIHMFRRSFSSYDLQRAIELFALVLGIECAYWADWKDDLADRGDDLADFCMVHIAIEFCDVDLYGVFLVFNVFHTPKGV